MALDIEDGSIVPGANSYVSEAEFKSYAEVRGVELPTEDSELIPFLIAAMDYIESYEPKFKGKRVSPEQPLSWPRQGVRFYGANFPDNLIPNQIKVAQMQAGLLVAAGTVLMPNITGFAVRREKVDVIEVEYATGGGQNNTATPEMTPSFPLIEAALEPLLRQVGLSKVYRA